MAVQKGPKIDKVKFKTKHRIQFKVLTGALNCEVCFFKLDLYSFLFGDETNYIVT